MWYYSPKSPRERFQCSVLIVFGLKPYITNQMLQQRYEYYGEVLLADVDKDLGMAEVFFAKPHQATRALHKTNGSMFHGEYLDVSYSYYPPAPVDPNCPRCQLHKKPERI